VRDQAPTCSVFSSGTPAQGGALVPTDSPITVGKMCVSGTDTVPLANSMVSFRVEFPTAAVPGTTDADAAYWNGATSNGSPVTAGTNVVLWSNVAGPMYETSAPPFDPTQLLAIQFHVIASASGTTPFSFCISNLTALTSP
jgi:hypothetical protein